MDYKNKYLKYKKKYISLKNIYFGGGRCFKYGLQQHTGECWHDSLSMMLFQSDITNKNDEFLNISDEQIHKQYQILEELFSPEYLKINSYKLPTEIYIYYLLNEKNQDINDKIKKFLDLSKKYMHALVERIQNRKKNDIPRYRVDYLLETLEKEKELYQVEFKDLHQLDIESKLLKEEKLARRKSFRKSIECSMHILTIAQLFDIEKEKFSKISHGGRPSVVNLAKEIINLYMDNTHYYYTDNLDLNRIDIYDTLINMLDNQQLIGIDIFIKFKDNAHAISAYICNNDQILYDNGLSYPLKINWKNSLKKILLKNKKSNIYTIPYFSNEKIISGMNFDQINLENFDNIKPILKEEIDVYWKEQEKEKKIKVPQNITGKEFKLWRDSIRKKIELEYIQNNIGFVYSINPCIIKKSEKNEEEHLLNNIITKFSLSPDKLNIAINRLLELKKINSINYDEIYKLINDILDKYIYINMYVICYLFDIAKYYFNQINDDYLYCSKKQIEILHKYPLIINNLSYCNFMKDAFIYMYLLFLNTDDSEKFLENLQDEQKDFLIKFIKQELRDNDEKIYVWDGKEFIEEFLESIIKKIKLINKTNNPFKQQIIDILYPTDKIIKS